MNSRIPSLLLGVLLSLSLAALGGCAAQNQRYASAGYATSSGKFDQRTYGPASPRVVAEGEEVPSGGGKYHVGKPYQIAGKTYYPSEKPVTQTGMASWYGADFHGRRTANGEVFNRHSISAAHPTMPLPSYARVTNLTNSHSMIVRVNDRGPYHGGRVMDVSQRVAEALDFHNAGTAHVKVEWVGRADLAGDNDAKLLATLRNDGAPAMLDGFAAPVMTAEQEEPAPVRKTVRVARKFSDETPTRTAARDNARDYEAMAYAAPQRRAETIVPVARVSETPAARPTPLDETAAAAAGADIQPASAADETGELRQGLN